MQQLGIFKNIPPEAYHKSHGVSSGAINAVLITPKDYLHYITTKKKATPRMVVGSAIHCAVLEGEHELQKRFVFEPEGLRGQNSSQKKELKQWVKQQDKTIIPRLHTFGSDADNVVTVDRCVTEIMANESAASLLSNGDAEISAWWEDEKTGLLCKARGDYKISTILIDLKMMGQGVSTQQASWYIKDFATHRQVAHYSNGLGCKTQIIVAFEPTGTYKVRVFKLDEETINTGYREVEVALERIVECKRTGEYPGYPDKIETVGLPYNYKEVIR